MNIAQPQPTENQNPQIAIQTVSRGAHAFCSILRCYMAATGPRAGWTKFSDTDKRAIINRHLEADGRRPISRATYYRWKAEAVSAGLLVFTSADKRKRDRKRVERGRWMRVTAIPIKAEGRRPRRLNETFPASPPNETFPAPYKNRDLTSRRDPENTEWGGEPSLRAYSVSESGRSADTPPRQSKAIREENTEHLDAADGALRWNHERRAFVGDLEPIRQKVRNRYEAELGQRWINAVSASLHEWAEDNPERMAAKTDHGAFFLDWFRREAREKRGGGPWTPRPETMDERIDRAWRQKAAASW